MRILSSYIMLIGIFYSCFVKDYRPIGKEVKVFYCPGGRSQHPVDRIRRCLPLEVVVTGQGPLFKVLLKVLKKVPI